MAEQNLFHLLWGIARRVHGDVKSIDVVCIAPELVQSICQALEVAGAHQLRVGETEEDKGLFPVVLGFGN